MRILIILAAFIGFAYNGQAQTTEEKNLERALFDLPGVSFTRLSRPEEPNLQYLLRVKQPLDHTNESRGFFYQRVVLTHRGFHQPTVMSTQGYQLNNLRSRAELELALDANGLNIEHRYFGESVPDSLNWKYLTLEQVTGDLHHINQLLKQVYQNKWISTGISKGGQTTIFYKYFYPSDVDVWVPYVAPLNQSIEDPRIYRFLDTVGSADCRKKIFEFQRYLLQQEDKALEKLKWFAKGADLNFSYLDNSLGKAYEYTVLEFSFAFWQLGGRCEEIPVKQSLDSSLTYLLRVSELSFFADAGMKQYAPHYYQAATQMGYYGYNIEPFRKYLKHFKTNPLATFPPKEAGPVQYDNSLNVKVDQWLRENGNNMIYIYGGADTWSAERVIPAPGVNARSFILPGKDHGHGRIKFMDPAMKEEMRQLLQQWTGLKVDFSMLK